VGVFIPKDAGCCGIPALSSGDTDTFNNLVRYNLKMFSAEKFDVLVTACATCTSTIKKLWPTLAEDLSPQELDRVKDLAGKTMDISQFLVEKLGIREAARTETEKRPESPTTIPAI
jgi:glycolate oxidase iron-sulfur subunit